MRRYGSPTRTEAANFIVTSVYLGASPAFVDRYLSVVESSKTGEQQGTLQHCSQKIGIGKLLTLRPLAISECKRCTSLNRLDIYERLSIVFQIRRYDFLKTFTRAGVHQGQLHPLLVHPRRSKAIDLIFSNALK